MEVTSDGEINHCDDFSNYLIFDYEIEIHFQVGMAMDRANFRPFVGRDASRNFARSRAASGVSIPSPAVQPHTA
jgi:hypothetical protein